MKTLATILATLAIRRFIRDFGVGWVRSSSKHHASLIREWTYKTDYETAEYRARNGGKDPNVGGYPEDAT